MNVFLGQACSNVQGAVILGEYRRQMDRSGLQFPPGENSDKELFSVLG